MKLTYVYEQPRALTVAELCEALADGNLPSRQNDEFYTVSRSDLLRFSRAQSRKVVMLNSPYVDHQVIASYAS